MDRLTKENTKRFGACDAYSYELLTIKRLLRASLSDYSIAEKASEYQKNLKLVLDEIKYNIQNM